MAQTSLDDLRFEVDVSVRYHHRRCGFFEFWHRVVAALSILGGSAVVAGLSSNIQSWLPRAELWAIVAALTVAVLNTLDLVIGFARSASEHEALYRRFLAIAIDLSEADETNDAQIRALASKRLRLESEEQPPHWGIYALCWNQAVEYLRRGENRKRKIPYGFWFWGMPNVARWWDTMFPIKSKPS